MKKPISPWPFAIVGLLALNAAVVILFLFISKSDGGAQVVPDYYNRAVAWDSLAANRARTIETGWQLAVLDPNRADTLVFVVTDADGNTITGFAGTLALSRPQLAAPIARATFSHESKLVVPAQNLPTGLYDVTADLSRGGKAFHPEIRFERIVSRR